MEIEPTVRLQTDTFPIICCSVCCSGTGFAKEAGSGILVIGTPQSAYGKIYLTEQASEKIKIETTRDGQYYRHIRRPPGQIFLHELP